MNKLTTFYFLNLAFFVSEFFLQGNVLALKKRGANKYMLYHVVIVTLLFLIPLVGYPLGKAIIGALITFLTHLIVDMLRVELGKIFKLTPDKYFYWVLFGMDQILHLTAIFLVLTYIL